MDAMKALFVIVRRDRVPGQPDVVIQLRAYNQDTAEVALEHMKCAVPRGYTILDDAIVATVKARDGLSAGQRRYVSLRLRRGSHARGLTVSQWRERFAQAWAASRRPATAPASPQTCERPSAPKPSARS